MPGGCWTRAFKYMRQNTAELVSKFFCWLDTIWTRCLKETDCDFRTNGFALPLEMRLMMTVNPVHPSDVV